MHTLYFFNLFDLQKLPGVIKYIKASNIPKGGVNNFMPAGFDPEEV